MGTVSDEQRFRDILAVLAVDSEKFWANGKVMQAEYEAELAADYHTRFPRRKYVASKFDECPNGATITAKWKAEVDKVCAAHDDTKKERKAELDKIAEALEVWITPELNLVHTVHASTYASQGFGCEKYTRQRAESYADTARFNNLTAEVRPVGERCSGSYGMSFQDYGVFVNTDSVGWELVQRKPSQTIKEWLKSCWKRGVNPRVYNPFLPYGLEEKMGLDYFGGEAV